MAAAITGLALAGGGFGDTALGVATAAVWLLILGLGFGRRLFLGGLTGTLVAAAGLLALLAAWTALSLSWAGDDGAGFSDLVRALLYLGVVVLVGLTARSGSAPSWLAGIALGGVAVATLAVASRTLGFGGDVTLARELPLAAERLSYPLGYWNALGYLMAMTLATLAWLTAAARPRVAGGAVAGTVPVVVALFLTSSRGALLAAVLGLLVVVWFAADRRPLLLAAVAATPAWTVTIVVAAARRGALEASSGLTLWGLVVAIVVLLAAAGAFLALARLEPRRAAGAALPRLGRRWIVAGVIVLVAVVAAIGPRSFVGEFRGQAGPAQGAGGLASDSFRSSFWGTALDAFAADPLRGTGAGGYENYWNMHGDLDVPTVNAHSAPLEMLAELGVVGGLVLPALLGVALLAARSLLAGAGARRRGEIGAALALLAVGVIAVAIDWTWQLPAAVAPLLIALALLGGAGLGARGAGSVLVDSRIAGYEPLDAPPQPPAWATWVALGAVGLASVWAAVVLAASSIQLERSSARLAEGRLQGAAEAARAAAAIEPWSPEPSLRLAEIEQVAANLQAARRRAEEAVSLSPEDYRPWLLLAELQRALGNPDASNRYLVRAALLAPRVLSRAGNALSAG